jgi:hypothetical protein
MKTIFAKRTHLENRRKTNKGLVKSEFFDGKKCVATNPIEAKRTRSTTF